MFKNLFKSNPKKFTYYPFGEKEIKCHQLWTTKKENVCGSCSPCAVEVDYFLGIQMPVYPLNAGQRHPTGKCGFLWKMRQPFVAAPKATAQKHVDYVKQCVEKDEEYVPLVGIP